MKLDMLIKFAKDQAIMPLLISLRMVHLKRKRNLKLYLISYINSIDKY